MNVIIIGGGIAGLTAGLWCGRAALTNLVFTAGKCETSSMISTTSIVENFPGFKSIEGKELITKLKKQATTYNANIVEKCITRVNFSSIPFRVYDLDGNEYKSSSIIIATGSIPNRLNLENEQKLWGKYISTCVTCDGRHFKNKRVIVLGGGDSSLEEALHLTNFTNKITLIHRRNAFRASVVLQKRVINNPKIKIIFDHVVVRINADGNKLGSLICKNIKDDKEVEIKTDGLFYALGFKPNSKLFEGVLELDERGYIVRKDFEHFETATSIPGVFFAGDVGNTQKYKQAVLCAAQGATAALDIDNYLHQMHIIEDDYFLKEKAKEKAKEDAKQCREGREGRRSSLSNRILLRNNSAVF